MEDKPLPETAPASGGSVTPVEPEATGPKKLHLQPRGTTNTTESSSTTTAKSNPFGAAKPREEILKAKGVDIKVADEKIEAKVAKPRYTKAQQDEVDVLQTQIDSESTDELTNKMKDLLAGFKKEEIEQKAKATTEAPKRFERPSERRARLEQEGRGGDSRGGGGYERQGNFSSFGGGGSGGRGGDTRPGDWPCPSCQANNFASRNSCFKCNEPRV